MVTHQDSKNLLLTVIRQFWQLVGPHCSYPLPSRIVGHSVYVNERFYRPDVSPCTRLREDIASFMQPLLFRQKKVGNITRFLWFDSNNNLAWAELLQHMFFKRPARMMKMLCSSSGLQLAHGGWRTEKRGHATEKFGSWLKSIERTEGSDLQHKIWMSREKSILSDPRCVRLGSSLHPMQFIGCTVRPLKTARTALFPCLGAVQSHQIDWCLRANDSEIITGIQPAKIIYLFPPFSRVALNGSCMFLSSFYQTICQRIVKCVIMAYHGIKSSLRRFLIVRFF